MRTETFVTELASASFCEESAWFLSLAISFLAFAAPLFAFSVTFRWGGRFGMGVFAIFALSAFALKELLASQLFALAVRFSFAFTFALFVTAILGEGRRR